MVPPKNELRVVNLSAKYRDFLAIRDMSVTFNLGVSALVGQERVGKSTFFYTLCRIHEAIKGATVSGQAFLGGNDIFADTEDPVTVGRTIQVVTEHPHFFPTISIADAVYQQYKIAGPAFMPHPDPEIIVEGALREVLLWDEVKNGLSLNVELLTLEQQQRISLARAVAMKPRVLLLDNPMGLLNLEAMRRFENVISHLRQHYTIVLASQNLKQIVRLADQMVVMLKDGKVGYIAESGTIHDVMNKTQDPKVSSYLDELIQQQA